MEHHQPLGTDLIHPSLCSLHAHLQAIRRCLLEMKKHAPWSQDDVMRWKLILKRIDDQRVNGIYVGEPVKPASKAKVSLWERIQFWRSTKVQIETVPSTVGLCTATAHAKQDDEAVKRGQALLHALWNECYELVLELEEAQQTENESEEEAEQQEGQLRSFRSLPVSTFRSSTPTHTTTTETL